MPTLDTIYNKEQDRIDGFIKGFDGEAEKVFKRVQRIAQAQLAGLSTDDILNYEFAWRDSLKQAGYYDLVNDLIDKQFDQMYQGTVDAFAEGGFDKAIFTADDAVKIQTLKNMKRNQFIRLADDVGLTVKRELYKYAISDASLVDMTKGIAQTLAGSDLAKYSKTYALTAIGEFQQELIDLRAKDVGDGVWVYVGVNDGATRQFCSNLLVKNETYTDEEKNELEGNPKRAYNCRHRFYKMKDEEAEASGYGKRIEPVKKTPKVVLDTADIDLGYKGKWNGHINGTTDKAKAVINKLSKPDNIKTGSGGFYSNSKTVQSPLNSKRTFLHEYGHFIDHQIGGSKQGISIYLSEKRLAKAALKDGEKLGLVYEGFNKEGATKRISKMKELKKNWFKKEDVFYTRGRRKGQRKGTKSTTQEEYQKGLSDIVDSITKGAFKTDYSMFGHGRGYYQRGSAQPRENFANLFSLWGDDAGHWEEAKELFPSLTKEFDSIMGEVIDGKFN